MSRRRRRRPEQPRNRGTLRIIAGEHAGRRLDTPSGPASRPTSDRIRESIANAIASRDGFEGATVIDAFAGSGALGIEALSRGARRAVFADTSRAAIAVIEANVDALDLQDRAEIRRVDALTALQEDRWDLILLDPPYDRTGWDELLAVAARHLEDDGLIVVETDRPVPVPADLDVSRTRRHGGTVVMFLTHPGAHE